jgi:regulator of sigma E protease
LSWLTDAFFYVVPFLLIFTLVVFVHELGHFWAARRNGLPVQSFALGFGREIWGRTDARGTRWRVNLVPFGGYILMPGLDDEEEGHPSAGIFDKPPEQRFWVSVAGPLSNYLLAFLLLSGIYIAVGRPDSSLMVSGTLADSPAAKADIFSGDVITQIDDTPVLTFSELRQALEKSQPGTKITVHIKRQDQELEKHLIPAYTEKKNILGRTVRNFSLGIFLAEGDLRPLSFPKVLWYGLQDVGHLSWGMATALGRIFTGEQSLGSLGGPVRIAEMAGEVSKSGSFTSILLFVVSLSINLGLVNLFPLPGLDGGTALFCLFEKLLRRPVSRRVREVVGYSGFVVLGTLMLFTLGNDLVRLPALQKFRAFLGI